MSKSGCIVRAALILVCVFGANSRGEYSGGFGTEAEPYEISAVADWQELMDRSADWDKHFILTADLDLGGVALSPVGNDVNEFAGSFDGKYHIIRNAEMDMRGVNYVGLFGYVASSAPIRRLGIEDSVIKGAYYVGALVGYNEGSGISNCYADASVTGSRYVGGLVGRYVHIGLSNCYTAGSVKGSSHVGGLAGSCNSGGIRNCYSASLVDSSRDADAGGLIGHVEYDDITSIARAYFLNAADGGGPHNGFGVPLSKNQMRQQSSFVGLDFVGESSDGMREIWQMPGGGGYPVLGRFHGYMSPVLAGAGTPEDPYLISDTNEFGVLYYYDHSACYRLTADIDLSGIVWSVPPIESFYGRFDGNGHIIHNLNIDCPDRYGVGLFGYIGSGGDVRNIGLRDVDVTGADYVGGLVGRNYGDNISNCYVTGSVSGEVNVGVLVGWNEGGDITKCYANGVASGSSRTACLVGWNDRGSISNCYSGGQASSDFYTGGLVGFTSGWGIISNCYSSGRASGGRYVGGLAGNNGDGRIINSYASGRASGDDYVGGLAGANGSRGKIARSYFLHANDGGGPDNGIGSVFTDLQMHQQAYFAGWDFVGESSNGTNEIWQIPTGGGYPELCSFEGYIPAAMDGAGTSEDPYLISDANEFGGVYHYDSAACYRLAADIDLSGITWSVPPVPVFSGSFDGNGYVIRNMDVNASHLINVGLVGRLVGGAVLSDIGLEDVNVAGYYYVGGLAGHSDNSTVTNCYATGWVSGYSHVGGLVGSSYYGGISNCYATGSVNSTGGEVGGLVGRNDYGSIGNCYASGPVSGDYYVGGVVGRNYHGSIDNCYASGLVNGGDGYGGGLVGRNSGRITACFWDVETSEQSVSDGGVGLTTIQMQSLTIYRNAGWGGEGWVIADGVDYPHLAWEGAAGVAISEPESVPLLGAGTAEDPYQVSTGSDFALLSWRASVLDKHIELTGEIDLEGVSLYPIGDLGSFTGVFEGNDHIIRNADINIPSGECIGLFNYVGPGAEIRNTGVEGSAISGDYYVGALVGYNDGGNIINCYAIALVGGYSYVGGLVGYNDGGSITDCNVTGSVDGGRDVGGLAGYSDGGSISNCVTAASVGGDNSVGGLVGHNHDGSITKCSATGSVSWSGNSVGGLVGSSHGSITDCYATGSVSGGNGVSGLVGNNAGSIINCYATGSIDGNISVGGLVGLNGGRLTNCYATGSVNGSREVGGLVGVELGGGMSYCYATGSVTGGNYVGGLTGSTVYYYYGYYDYDYVEISHCHATGPVIGSGDYVGGLMGLSSHCRIADCYATGSVTTIGDCVGGLAGGSYFGSLANSYAAGSVSGNSMVGGLAGQISRILYYGDIAISNCYATGSADGNDYVGGLVGHNEDAEISNCYSVGSADGNDYVGGLVGRNEDAEIINCYAVGSADGNDYVGGLVGESYRGIVWKSFWDVNSTGLDFSAGGMGMPTPQMQTRSTYVDAHWDFVGEANNGTDNMWTICEGTNYPRLVWQIPSADLLCPDGVAGGDFSFFAQYWRHIDCNSANEYCGGTDFDWSGGVDGTDLVLFAGQWLQETAWSDVSFLLSGPPSPASEPNPPDGGMGTSGYSILGWSPGKGAFWHDVYFGSEAGGVADANTTSAEYRGRQAATTFSTEPLAGETSYYWRIDEINHYGTTTGTVWNFTTTGKGRACFPGDTPVWVDGEMVEISKVVAGAMVDKPAVAPMITDLRKTVCTHQIEDVDVHGESDSWDRYDIVFENGNTLAVADSHYFLLDSGQWASLGKLTIGSKLSTLEGPVAIKTMKKTKSTGTVYNLKIKNADRYLVGKDGIIVRDW